MSDRAKFPEFDEYVVHEFGGWGGAGTCSGCDRQAPRLTIGVPKEAPTDARNTCEWCVQYLFGSEQSGVSVTRALVYGAIWDAVRETGLEDVIRSAAEDALSDQYDRRELGPWSVLDRAEAQAANQEVDQAA